MTEPDFPTDDEMAQAFNNSRNLATHRNPDVLDGCEDCTVHVGPGGSFLLEKGERVASIKPARIVIYDGGDLDKGCA